MAIEPTEFQRFKTALSQAIKVPKSEILRREREDKEARRQKRQNRSREDGAARPA
jgi:hypothetical protein